MQLHCHVQPLASITRDSETEIIVHAASNAMQF